MLSANDLEYMRSSIEQLLPDTCNLLTVTRTADGFGGWNDTWGTAAAGVSCRVDPLRGSEQRVGEALRPYHTYVVTLPHDTTITEQYRIEWGTVLLDVSSANVNSLAGCKRVYAEVV